MKTNSSERVIRRINRAICKHNLEQTIYRELRTSISETWARCRCQNEYNIESTIGSWVLAGMREVATRSGQNRMFKMPPEVRVRRNEQNRNILDVCISVTPFDCCEDRHD